MDIPYPTPEVRGGGREEKLHDQGVAVTRAQEGQEELLHVQGKEQQLHFAGAAVKRYPTSKVRETQVRQ